MLPQMTDEVKSNSSTVSSASTEAATSVQVHPATMHTMPPTPPSPLSKTTEQEFLEFEGTTIFAPSPSPTYRYSLTLKNGKLRIWVEDCESKKQWCTTELNVQDYVDDSNVIPDANASDYVECFRELLDTAPDDVANIPNSFQRHHEDIFRLELAVKIQVLRKTRVATYTFALEPISVERIDVLESKLRDLQDEVESLRTEGQEAASGQTSSIQKLEEGVKKLQKDVAGRDAMILQLKDEMKAMHTAHESPVIIPVQSTTKALGDLICWKNAVFTFNLKAILTGLDGIVQVEFPGTYQAIIIVNHQPAGPNLSIQMMKGSECIQSVCCGYTEGHCASTSFVCTTHLVKNDQLTVKCSANLVGTSYLTLIRLGK